MNQHILVSSQPIPRLQWFAHTLRFIAAPILASLILASLTSVCNSQTTATETAVIDFQRDIATILAEHCTACHADDNREGGLRLDQRRFAFAPSDSDQRAIVPGNVEQSELVRRLTTQDPDRRMPLDGEPLTKVQITRITKWIEQGAPWPADDGQESHWAYRVPSRPTLPQADIRWGKNEIDRFIAAQHAQHQFSPALPAAPARLIRRLYLDLIGLPPSPKVVGDFVASPTDEAYERIVDELLASPRYGEKWARAWLDLARYSDSNGYQADQLRDMWAYRDWVIAAMNADMPFDQFTIEQIAGDLLPGATLSQRIATGFHRTPTCNVEAGVDPEGNRTDQVIDRVNTTGTVWLGTTIECAQCHNHKYDPFSQREYYQLFAFFNSTPIEVENASNPNGVQFDFYGPKLELPMDRWQRERRQTVVRDVEVVRAQLDQLKEQVLPRLAAWEADICAEDSTAKDGLPPKVQKALDKSRDERSKQEHQLVVDHFLAQQPEVAVVQKTFDKLSEQRDATDPDSTLVMVEMQSPRTTNVFLRGQFLQPGEIVQPSVPEVLHDLPTGEGFNRLDLAHWLVSRDNPLVARVTVNRWWYELFGRGLVTTLEDFGSQGAQPSHPGLLDWLAVEFMENAWSMKHIHRLIVTSATYRQSPRTTPAQRLADPKNRWYARGPRNRLPAEMIRDNALAISGLLVHQLGGPPAYPPQPDGLWNQTGRNEPIYTAHTDANRYRRGVYVIWRRAAPYPSFVNFDAPDRMTCVVTRPRTNTPLQALTLLNDQGFAEAAQAFAAEILRMESLATDDDRLEFAFRKCVARPPTRKEREILTTELSAARNMTPTAATIDSVVAELPFPLPNKLDRNEWWAWYSVANVLLNLDETISK